jgi:hypothetical protein
MAFVKSCVFACRAQSGDLIGMIERCREGHRLCKIYKIATTGELQHLPQVPLLDLLSPIEP